MNAPRDTPYDIVFGDAFDETFRTIRDQLEGAEPESALGLAQLPATGELLRALLPESDGAAGHSAVFTQVGQLVYHAFLFWHHGRHVYRIGENVLRPLLAGAPFEPAAPLPPREAGYVQLPRNVLWTRVDVDSAPEPLDGFFWFSHGAQLELLLALGVRAGRPGLSLIDVATADSALEQWRNAVIRPDGKDFANVLPGGELQGYHSLTLHGEVLKLAALCFTLMQLRATHEIRSEQGNEVHVIDG